MNQGRFNFLFGIIFFAIFLIIGRLFYWQIIVADELASQAEKQHYSSIEIAAKRGEIRTSDGYPLALNTETYLVFAYLPELEKSAQEIANTITPLVFKYMKNSEASPSAKQANRDFAYSARAEIENKLNRDDVLWIPLVRNVDISVKKEIAGLKISGLGTEATYRRDYPEASMAASLVGFVGSDKAGNSKGYFGIEGFYDFELRGKPGVLRQERDASGKPILIGQFEELDAKEGRHLILHLDRAVQRIAEKTLKKGLEMYGALSGEVIIMNPKNGALLAMTSLPSYDPGYFKEYDQSLFKNPAVSEFYEPGSTFKVITMAAALDTKAVKPETLCEICDGPVRISGYTIETWDDKYHPNSSMKEVIQFSDNIGMVFAVSKLGKEDLLKYLSLFGIGEKSGIDLEEEASPVLRAEKEWKEIDLATSAFGQGIAVTGIQMVRAVAAIANKGIINTPRVVDKVIGEKTIEVDYKKGRRVISEETAQQMTEMLVNAVDKGEAKWAKPIGYKIAGKTGTSQIPVAGHYDKEKTIASFIGFAPADDPRFIMLVKLREPKSSPWGSETAAPLWFSIAKDLLLYYGIQPNDY